MTMIISELVNQLNELKAKHGDIKVVSELSGTFRFEAVDCDPPRAVTVLYNHYEKRYTLSFKDTPETQKVITL